MRFYKVHINDSYWKWYVDLPEYDGSKEDLLMVMGADIMLDKIMQYQDLHNEVKISIDTVTYGDHHIMLKKVKEHSEDEYGSGATYNVMSDNELFQVNDIWLCDVMLWVFGEFPNRLYIKIK